MPKALTLVQITDSHLHASSEDTLLGMNTENSLKLIIDRVGADVPAIDLIIATGDITQDGSTEGYRKFLQLISPLSAALRWIPGNHDSPAAMAAVDEAAEYCEAVYVHDNWVVVMLDSTVPGEVHGTVADEQLELLATALQQYPDKHILVTLHHHPVQLHSQWIDQIGLTNASELHQLMRRHTNIRAVVCGHVHQENEQTLDGVRYLSSPSTCVQFMPATSAFTIDPLGPGYRLLRLHPDGSIETTVQRIQGVDFEIDYARTGY